MEVQAGSEKEVSACGRVAAYTVGNSWREYQTILGSQNRPSYRKTLEGRAAGQLQAVTGDSSAVFQPSRNLGHPEEGGAFVCFGVKAPPLLGWTGLTADTGLGHR